MATNPNQPESVMSIVGSILASMAGRGGRRSNPSFPLTRAQAREDLWEMHRNPVPLERPVVVLGGWLDPTLSARYIRSALSFATTAPRILTISFFTARHFAMCRRRVIGAVDRVFPNADPLRTTEVDVVGFSMGGLVARYSAAACGDQATGGRRLRIARLFTISTPHRGSCAAPLIKLGALARDMRPGSDFLMQLNCPGNAPGYPVIPYVRLRDAIVGTANAAPVGRPVWWVDSPPMSSSHRHAFREPRILADIARRLRGEKPFTLNPPAPLPGSPSEPHHNAGQSASAGQSQRPAPSL